MNPPNNYSKGGKAAFYLLLCLPECVVFFSYLVSIRVRLIDIYIYRWLSSLAYASRNLVELFQMNGPKYAAGPYPMDEEATKWERPTAPGLYQ
jgi:hypothetical protein